ncbi:hypothetical protein [Streptomyces sp. BP-8]|uniref:Uncharacterized protein n=1 Tax=Streptomyces sirii TaxID=3127701 RepID=A0ABZ2QL35_9ACTN
MASHGAGVRRELDAAVPAHGEQCVLAGRACRRADHCRSIRRHLSAPLTDEEAAVITEALLKAAQGGGTEIHWG